MIDAIKLTEFIEGYLFQYGIENDEYHVEVGEDDEWYSTAFPDEVITENDIDRMLMITGLTRDELLGMPSTALNKYFLKYPFFKLDKEFQNTFETESQFLDHDDTVWGPIGKTVRYDVKNLKKRVIRKTMEINQAIPGIYHPDAFPVGLIYSSEWMISFPRFAQLARSLFNIIARYKELFFKAIDTDLEDEEISEMNFLASSLDVRDLVRRDVVLYYPNVVRFRDVYHTENLKDFLSYVRIGRMERTRYWRCEEFLNDRKLAWTYINLYPEAFSEVRKYLMRSDYFSCWFYWSDDIPEELETEMVREYKPQNANETSPKKHHDDFLLTLDDDEYEEYLHRKTDGEESDVDCFVNNDPYDPDYPYEMDSPYWLTQEEELEERADEKDFLGIEYISPEDEWDAPFDSKQIHLYIEKQSEEKYNHNKQCYNQLREMIQPAEKGGFPIPKRECASDNLTLENGSLFDRKAARCRAMAGGV